MADKKISQLPAATTPLAGTEVLPIVQGGTTDQVSVANLTAGRAISATQYTSTIATGTAPLVVTSTTEVANLKAATATLADSATTANAVKSNATTGVLQVTGPAAAATRVMTTPDANFTVARTDAAQTFTGQQNFTTATRVTAAADVTREYYSSSTAIFTGTNLARNTIYGNDGGEAIVAYQDWRANGNHSPNSRSMRMYVGLATGSQQTATDKFYVEDTGGIRPASDNAVSNGAAANRWSEIFAGNGTINTSDARTKTAVKPLTATELAAAKDLAKEIGTFKFLSAVAEKGNAARSHIGMTVQRAIEIMKAHGLDPMAYGFICYDKWDEIIHRAAKDAVVDEEGNVIEPAVEANIQPAGDLYSFRPDQLALFICRGFEERLAALENK